MFSGEKINDEVSSRKEDLDMDVHKVYCNIEQSVILKVLDNDILAAPDCNDKGIDGQKQFFELSPSNLDEFIIPNSRRGVFFISFHNDPDFDEGRDTLGFILEYGNTLAVQDDDKDKFLEMPCDNTCVPLKGYKLMTMFSRVMRPLIKGAYQISLMVTLRLNYSMNLSLNLIGRIQKLLLITVVQMMTFLRPNGLVLLHNLLVFHMVCTLYQMISAFNGLI